MNQARTIITTGIRTYNKKKAEAQDQGTSLYRKISCPRSRLQRMVRKKADKHSWFQKPPEDSKITSQTTENKSHKNTENKVDLRKTLAILSIPRTHDGSLVRMLRKAENNIRAVCTTKIRVTEQVGQTLRSLLCRSNPWLAKGALELTACHVKWGKHPNHVGDVGCAIRAHV